MELRSQIVNSWFENDLKFKAVTVVNGIKLWFSNMGFPITKREIESIAYNFDVTPICLKNFINFKTAQMVHKFNLFLVNSIQRRRTVRDIEMNAFYMYQKNIMVISPAFLFPPFFHAEAPMAYNFGRLGRVVGHEITHAFDYTLLKPMLGYNAANEKQFKRDIASKLVCFINQFDQLKNGSGFHTLEENIADTQGLKLAFRAMRRHIEKYSETADERLGNLHDLDANKLFFIAFANDLCESRKYAFFDRTHSAARERVIGTLQNMEEFAEAFNCTIGRPMNPEGDKCDFWKM
ncbi:endothelin-converting enzyme 1-like isoform X3 [Leptopilina heterotoma]|nr:endothelin-converting enzyme 1-like isoform X3 [Leptopilina heterotoma]